MPVRRSLAWAVVFSAASLGAACTLFTDLDGYADEASSADAGGEAGDGGSSGLVDAQLVDAPPGGPSCRAIRAAGAAVSGVYALTSSDGGTYEAYCDMISFDGGWTLLTERQIVEEKATQDVEPASPARVDATHQADARGGLVVSAKISSINCGADNLKAGPRYHLLFGELDSWTQLMATYDFTGSYDCWALFGHQNVSAGNVVPFDLALDRMDPQENMGRTDAGAVIPFDGRISYCDTASDNFWASAYDQAPKRARVVQRRKIAGAPSGIAVAADCGSGGGWRLSEIFVR
jgi:Fibrinogen beta and gamma chains, C-terminal globular domain